MQTHKNSREAVFLTIDALIFVNPSDILLIRRRKFPFKNKLVLPGGHVEREDKNCVMACAREIQEEIGLMVSPQDLTPFMILDGKNRDPRQGRRVSIVFRAVIWDSFCDNQISFDYQEVREVVIKNINTIKKSSMGFDHYLVLQEWKRRCN